MEISQNGPIDAGTFCRWLKEGGRRAYTMIEKKKFKRQGIFVMPVSVQQAYITICVLRRISVADCQW